MNGFIRKLLRRKRRLSLVAIVKNEADYLLEWIAFHRKADFDYFYIADNGSTDNTGEILAALDLAGVLTYVDWPRQETAQFAWYKHALEHFGSETNLMAFMDADEFLFSRGTESVAKRIGTLMKAEHVGAVAINWQIFGSSGHKTKSEGLVVERFTEASSYDHPVNLHVKSIVKPSAVAQMWAHTAELHDGFTYVDVDGQPVEFVNDTPASGRTQKVERADLVVHHYAVKSEEEFRTNKSKRGRANLGRDHCRDMDYFRRHDLNEVRMDPERELTELSRIEMRRLAARAKLAHVSGWSAY